MANIFSDLYQSDCSEPYPLKLSAHAHTHSRAESTYWRQAGLIMNKMLAKYQGTAVH